MKYQYAVQLSETWAHLGEYPTSAQLGDALNSPGISPRDLMDTITALRPIYKREWLAEYDPYRLGTALGLWDAESRYWSCLQERLHAAEARFKTGNKLPALRSITQEF